MPKRSPPGPWTDEGLKRGEWLRRYRGGLNSALQALHGTEAMTPDEVAEIVLDKAHEAPRAIYVAALRHAAEFAAEHNQSERAAQLKAAAEILEGSTHD